MKSSIHSNVEVYTVAGESTGRPLPEWLIRKRKRSLKKDAEFANRVELLQDFEFEEASSCVRVSEDGNWVMSTGTYKPQIHVHHLPQLSLSFSRHTETLNQTFIMLSSDYSKSLHLQADRFLQFHSPSGCIYSTRIPRYGRDLLFDRRNAEALVPSTGLNADGNGEVFRLNLELGRFMKGYEVDVASEDGYNDSACVASAAVAEQSHNLLAFGTSLGTVEFWDSRSKTRAGMLSLPRSHTTTHAEAEVTALKYHSSGLTLAAGQASGLIHLFDLRSPTPLLRKDHGYGYPIKTLDFLESSVSTRAQASEPRILSSDKRIIKIWDARDGTPWTSVEPSVDINHVEWCKDSGMLLTANEGRQQHVFFIPQLGPAPKWCAFLDNLVEEMAEDRETQSGGTAAVGAKSRTGEVYDNYKFLTLPQLRALNIDHLIGKTSLLRPYMHGYFVGQRLYEEASLISNPEFWQQQRTQSIQKKIEAERESRIRGKKKVQVKVNRKLAERMLEREEKNERRKAKRVLAKGGDDVPADAEMPDAEQVEGDASVVAAAADAEPERAQPARLLDDDRFAGLFQDAEFEIDEHSREFQAHNPSTKVDDRIKDKFATKTDKKKGFTAVEEEDLEDGTRKRGGSSDDDSDENSGSDDSGSESVDSEEAGVRSRNTTTAKKQDLPRRHTQSAFKRSQSAPKGVQMTIRSSHQNGRPAKRSDQQSFGSRAAFANDNVRSAATGARKEKPVVGEREVSFVPAGKKKQQQERLQEGKRRSKEEHLARRSASGNTFRRL